MKIITGLLCWILTNILQYLYNQKHLPSPKLSHSIGFTWFTIWYFAKSFIQLETTWYANKYFTNTPTHLESNFNTTVAMTIDQISWKSSFHYLKLWLCQMSKSSCKWRFYQALKIYNATFYMVSISTWTRSVFVCVWWVRNCGGA